LVVRALAVGEVRWVDVLVEVEALVCAVYALLAEEGDEALAAAFWIVAVGARNAAKKLEKKGRLVVISSSGTSLSTKGTV